MNFFKNNFKNNANLTRSKDTLIKNMTKFRNSREYNQLNPLFPSKRKRRRKEREREREEKRGTDHANENGKPKIPPTECPPLMNPHRLHPPRLSFS